MNLSASLFALTFVTCIAAFPAAAQQSSTPADTPSAEQTSPGRDLQRDQRRSPTAGNFQLEIGGNNTGMVTSVEGEKPDDETGQQPQISGAAARQAVTPRVTGAPVVILPPTAAPSDDKDDD